MYYGVSGYTEDLQAWQQRKDQYDAWQTRRRQLEARWDEYEVAYAAASAECQERTEKWEKAIAARTAYIPRYEADLANCQRREQLLSNLNAQVNAWKARHGIIGQFSLPPCLSSVDAQRGYQNTCEQQTQIRGLQGLPSGLGYAYLQADADAAFRNTIDQRTQENIYCVLDDLPICPRLPKCEGLTPPGPTPQQPVCQYPGQPPSITTLGDPPPPPGSQPTPPSTPDLPPPVVREDLPVTEEEPPPEEVPEEEEGGASFAMYGILALLLLGGGYFVYRTVK